ncbi:DUF397 domain-containing protein [Thermomonospora catenispora]|uniref:DUF397 domain-containing protein n=1 Tax=Thermomonospora catenispora TaxID=2493090 RepID=UPI00111DDDA1|nr:DUF397 domain-containing protein [Thermomonospora catenispora]TNY35477.1 DUF397 domain-containing protein [Thermomonospora catenispora]
MSARKWRKSSYSASNGGNCVEVARLAEGVGVRDSKSPEHGHLSLTSAQFAALLAQLKR